jgi:ferredoxin
MVINVPYTVTINPRENCISCCNCHTNCPDVFELNSDDGLSQIKEDYRIEGKIGKDSIPASLEDCVRLAEDLCPVSIIYVEKE